MGGKMLRRRSQDLTAFSNVHKMISTRLGTFWIWICGFIACLHPSRWRGIRDLVDRLRLWCFSVRSRVSLGSGEKQRMLEWVHSKIPNLQPPTNFTSCWKDGIMICALVEELVPGSCPRYDLLNAENSLANVKLGLKLVEQATGIKPGVMAEEIVECHSGTERKLFCLLSQMKLAAAKLKIKTVLKRPVIEVNKQLVFGEEQDCIAKGMGLALAVRGRKARFNIYLKSTTNLNIVIEIKGPKGTYCTERITNRSPKRKRNVISTSKKVHDPSSSNEFGDESRRQKNDQIPFDYEVFPGKLSLSYTPLCTGKHRLSIIWQGQHIMGSPYNINVDESIINHSLKTKVRPPRRLLLPQRLNDIHRQDSFDSLRCLEQSPINHCVSCNPENSDKLSSSSTQKLGGVTKRRILRQVVSINGHNVVVEGNEKLTDAIKCFPERKNAKCSDVNESLKHSKTDFEAKPIKQNSFLTRQYSVDCQHVQAFCAEEYTDFTKFIQKEDNHSPKTVANKQSLLCTSKSPENIQKEPLNEEPSSEVETPLNYVKTKLFPKNKKEDDEIVTSFKSTTATSKNDYIYEQAMEKDQHVTECSDVCSEKSHKVNQEITHSNSFYKERFTANPMSAKYESPHTNKTCSHEAELKEIQLFVERDQNERNFCKEVESSLTQNTDTLFKTPEDAQSTIKVQPKFSCSSEVEYVLNCSKSPNKLLESSVLMTSDTNVYKKTQYFLHNDQTKNKEKLNGASGLDNSTIKSNDIRENYLKGEINRHIHDLSFSKVNQSEFPKDFSKNDQYFTYKNGSDMNISNVTSYFSGSSPISFPESSPTRYCNQGMVKDRVQKWENSLTNKLTINLQNPSYGDKSIKSNSLSDLTSNSRDRESKTQPIFSSLQLFIKEHNAFVPTENTKDDTKVTPLKSKCGTEKKNLRLLARILKILMRRINTNSANQPQVKQAKYFIIEKIKQKKYTRTFILFAARSVCQQQKSDTRESTFQKGKPFPNIISYCNCRTKTTIDTGVQVESRDFIVKEQQAAVPSLSTVPTYKKVDISTYTISGISSGYQSSSSAYGGKSISSAPLSSFGSTSQISIFGGQDSDITEDNNNIEPTQTNAGVTIIQCNKTSRDRSNSEPQNRVGTYNEFDKILQEKKTVMNCDCNFVVKKNPLFNKPYPIMLNEDNCLVEGHGQCFLEKETESSKGFIDDEIPDYATLVLGDYVSFTGLVDSDRPISHQELTALDCKEENNNDNCTSGEKYETRILLPRPEKCKAFGAGVYYGQVGVKNHFQVRTGEAGKGSLTVSIQGPGKHNVLETTVTYIGDDMHEVMYEVSDPGYYIISVKWCEWNIPESPFICKVTY
ncbi:uncharacterized protein LOC143231390 [Tachypleus tridentatus]|uniref:uncharacterized protein LOC143231390 n=1 Tax=Tachypleus tridentatus TaxID=6853 RepID=UPI003FD0E01A